MAERGTIYKKWSSSNDREEGNNNNNANNVVVVRHHLVRWCWKKGRRQQQRGPGKKAFSQMMRQEIQRITSSLLTKKVPRKT